MIDVDDTLDFVTNWAINDDHDPLLVVTAPEDMERQPLFKKCMTL